MVDSLGHPDISHPESDISHATSRIQHPQYLYRYRNDTCRFRQQVLGSNATGVVQRSTCRVHIVVSNIHAHHHTLSIDISHTLGCSMPSALCASVRLCSAIPSPYLTCACHALYAPSQGQLEPPMRRRGCDDWAVRYSTTTPICNMPHAQNCTPIIFICTLAQGITPWQTVLISKGSKTPKHRLHSRIAQGV